MLLLDNKLHLAPIVKELQRILDLGTGSGVWAIHMTDKFPNSSSHRVDWPHPPHQPPIRSRAPASRPRGLGPYAEQDVVTNLIRLGKPGGWIELVELNVYEPQDAGGPALRDFIRLLREIFTLAGMGGDFASKMRGCLEAARLEKVEERLVDC